MGHGRPRFLSMLSSGCEADAFFAVCVLFLSSLSEDIELNVSLSGD